MAFAMEWQPAASFPVDSVWITAIALDADVVVGDSTVAGFTLDVDTLRLGPYPDLVTMEYADVDWGELFDGVDAGQVRALFDEGFVLGNLRITAIRFDPEIASPDIVGEDTVYRPRRTGRSVRVGGGIFVDIPIYREPRYYPPRRGPSGDRAREPRGEQVGRGDARRDDDRQERDGDKGRRETSDNARKKGKRSDDDDDEDDEELLPAALMGAAAVAVVAVAGGTIGYYGNMKHAPIGLTAGYVQPEGGVLLQVAINEAVIHDSGLTPERGIARVVSFYDAFSSPVQPALGLGVMGTERGGDIEVDFSLSAGAVLRMGPVLLLGGVDLLSGGADLSLAYNFRYRRR